MKFATVPAAEVAGALLAHAQTVGKLRWAKGRRLTAADAAALAAAGIASITVARLEPGDVGEDEAAQQLAAALAGPGVRAAAPVHGRVNLIACSDGLVRAPATAVDALNAIDEALTLGTLADRTRVAAGDIVATIKVIPYAVPPAPLAAAIAAAVPIAIAGFAPRRVTLLQTALPGTSPKLLARTEAVTRARIAALGGTLAARPPVPHAADALAAALAAAGDADMLLIAGASATADRGDVIPAAIVAAGGSVERLGMPVDPGNLLVLASLGERPVIGLPGCARSPRRNGFDWVLERLFAGEAVHGADIAAMGSGGLLAETDRPEPRARAEAPLAPIGALLLAAGRGARLGRTKQLELLGDAPLVVHAARALLAAGLPVLVVLGHDAEAVRAALAGLPLRFVTAPDHALGMSHSLRAGLAAVPEDWAGAFVALADMPRIAPATLARLAAAAQSARSIVVPVADGRRGNPVLFGRAWFTRLADSTGDRGGRALLDEFADLVTEVDCDDGVLFDIDDAATLAAARAALPDQSPD